MDTNETPGTGEPSLSVIIPTLNAGAQLRHLLECLKEQSVAPDEIIVIDSESDDATVSIAKSVPGVRTIAIKRRDFDHGGTRHAALLESSGEFVLFLTQDAMPTGRRYIETLLEPFADGAVAMVSGRQVPKPDARRFEQLVREFNYPDTSSVRDKGDIPALGIKTFFASDVCAAYRRTAYLAVGGFPRPCDTNEDMLIAAMFIHSGQKVAYAADARVFHSHNLTLGEQYRRNKTVGVFLQRNGEFFGDVSEVGEGKALVISISKILISEHRFGEFVAFGVDSCARLLGNRAGRRQVIKELASEAMASKESAVSADGRH